MPINIIHVIDTLELINYGIWNAAVFGSDYLKRNYGYSSFIWVCEDHFVPTTSLTIPVTCIGGDKRKLHEERLIQLLAENNFLPQSTVFVSHGCWKTPTYLGYQLKKLGYFWIYTPHGMLEPWSMRHKKIKKLIYFSLFEKRWAFRSHRIRAVSEVERCNLKKMINREVETIENGVQVSEYKSKSSHEEVYLFMARLHYKKGVLPLAEAWNKTMRDASGKRLIIAGPDEGELEKIKPFLSDNLEYVGPVYGDQKKALLERAHYYVLPSFSEGFPTSVVEAMSYGLIPIISEGCNFPEIFNRNLGYRVEPLSDSIASVLTTLKDRNFDESLSLKNWQFITEHNSEEFLGDKLHALYLNILGSEPELN